MIFTRVELPLTKKHVELLLTGLVSLEGAIEAIHQPIPTEVDDVRKALQDYRNRLDNLSKETLSTKEVAQILGFSARRVHQLGRKNSIRIVRLGKKGRGRSTVYDAESVRQYTEKHSK